MHPNDTHPTYLAHGEACLHEEHQYCAKHEPQRIELRLQLAVELYQGKDII
jgi:hypothetical protein